MISGQLNSKILYITYDGLLDPLGQSQVAAYIMKLSKVGARYIVLTFEKKSRLLDKNNVIEVENELKSHGIIWHRLRYHKSPSVPATCFDIANGVIQGAYIIKRYGIKIIHARGFVASSIAFILQRTLRIKFIFDMRGLWPDEKVDARAMKKGGFVYKVNKAMERLFFKFSDYVVVLSSSGERFLKTIYNLDGRISVIPTCVDLSLFKIKNTDVKNDATGNGRFTFVYLGSLGSWYMLEEMVDFFNESRACFNNPLFLLINEGNHGMIKDTMLKKKVFHSDYYIKPLPYKHIGEGLNAADISISFIKPVQSKIVSCPTKFGESLACGIPVVINSGIGDTAEIVRKERIGVVVEDFSINAYKKALDELNGLLQEKDNLRQRCRYAAEKYFSLEDGVEKYMGIYKNLLSV